MSGPISIWSSHRRCERFVASHFEGNIAPRDERWMRRHLASCTACRGLYASLMAAEGRGQDAMARRRARIEAALFGPEGEEKRVAWLLWRVAVPALAVALIAGLISIFAWKANPDDVYRSKGAGDEGRAAMSRFVSVSLFRAKTDGGGFSPVKGAIARNDALAFSYTNNSPEFDNLMVFGVDEKNEVYWFYPAWTRPDDNPRSTSIERGERIRLPNQITHAYEGRRLRIFALFHKERDLRVKAIEAEVKRLAQSGLAVASLKRFPLEGSGQHSVLLEIKGAVR